MLISFFQNGPKGQPRNGAFGLSARIVAILVCSFASTALGSAIPFRATALQNGYYNALVTVLTQRLTDSDDPYVKHVADAFLMLGLPSPMEHLEGDASVAGSAAGLLPNDKSQSVLRWKERLEECIDAMLMPEEYHEDYGHWDKQYWQLLPICMENAEATRDFTELVGMQPEQMENQMKQEGATSMVGEYMRAHHWHRLNMLLEMVSAESTQRVPNFGRVLKRAKQISRPGDIFAGGDDYEGAAAVSASSEMDKLLVVPATVVLQSSTSKDIVCKHFPITPRSTKADVKFFDGVQDQVRRYMCRQGFEGPPTHVTKLRLCLKETCKNAMKPQESRAGGALSMSRGRRGSGSQSSTIAEVELHRGDVASSGSSSGSAACVTSGDDTLASLALRHVSSTGSSMSTHENLCEALAEGAMLFEMIVPSDDFDERLKKGGAAAQLVFSQKLPKSREQVKRLAENQRNLGSGRAVVAKCVAVVALASMLGGAAHHNIVYWQKDKEAQEWEGIATKQKQEIEDITARMSSLEKSATDWKELATSNFEFLKKQEKAFLKLRNASEQRAMTCERELERKDALNAAYQIQLAEAFDADLFFFKKMTKWLGETFVPPV
ncbi:unnamed protein product [Amoebophrya sp. A25]|nr:unnamed protein product [Amoebophrya sp. A25]|eukprot:GSA25T00012619001.1